jgi:hypothetical protein
LKQIVVISDLARRMPEAGRIRLGERTGRAMKSLDHLRFTSPRRDLIDQIAGQYGGTVTEWNEPSSTSPHQFQVTITADLIDVYLVPGGLNTQYEAWEGGGAARRCDGETCEIPVQTADGYDMQSVPCLCRVQNAAVCKPYTRMQLILPTIAFAGTWRLETKGWNAAHELPGMYDMISTLATSGQMITAQLGIEQRQKVNRGRKQHFVVPRLTIAQTALEIQAGAANALALTERGHGVATPALGTGVPLLAANDEIVDRSVGGDDEIIDAEVISDEELDAIERLTRDAQQFGLDPARFVSAVRAQIDASANDVSTAVRMRNASDRIRAEVMEPLGFLPDGKVQWKSIN